MMTVVTYLWGTRHFSPGHVQQLARSVDRWLAAPHRFRCITDQKVPGVKTVPDPARHYPSRCYRRLWLFSEAARGLGDQILHLDLDIVVCGPLDGLVPRASDFAIYKAGSIARRGYSLNPSVFWLRTGTQTDIWEQWKAHAPELVSRAKADGWWGSDQGVISYLRRNAQVETLGDDDGIVSFRRIRSQRLTAPPAGTRLVSFHGKRSPFEKAIQAGHPWIRQAWEVAA